MNTKIQTLKPLSIFSLLEEPDLEKISSVTTEKSYQKNEVIFHQGSRGSTLFVLKSGLVKISLIDSSGREAILRMISENDFFGEMSLLDGHFRSASITAVEESKAVLISREDFTCLIQQYPSIAFNMLASLSRRLRKTNEKIASLSFFDAYGKVARTLLDFIANQGERHGDQIILNLPFSRQEMANMTGISRETFARILNEFQVRGCLKTEGKKIVILDEAILKREIS